MAFQIRLPDQQIADVVETGLTPALTSRWLRIICPCDPERIATGLGHAIIEHVDPDDGETVAAALLNRESLILGLQRMVDQAPYSLASIVKGQYGAKEADVLLQLSLIGEVRYG